MSEADRKKSEGDIKSVICPRCHAKLKPAAQKCTQCGHWIEQDEKSISDFINEGGPDWPGE